MIFDKLDAKSYAIRAKMVGGCHICGGSGVIVGDLKEATPKGSECECVKGWNRIHQMIRAGILCEYWDVLKFDFSGTKNKMSVEVVQRYVNRLDRARDNGLNMFLSGNVDAGKTTAGCYVAVSAIEQGMSAFYVVLENLSGWWLEVVTSSGEAKKDAILELEYIEQIDMLVIDEMGKESGKDGGHVRSQLDTLLRARIANGLPFVCISQMDIAGVQEKYGKPLASLLTQRVKHLTFMSEGFRPKTQSTWATMLEGE